MNHPDRSCLHSTNPVVSPLGLFRVGLPDFAEAKASARICRNSNGREGVDRRFLKKVPTNRAPDVAVGISLQLRLFVTRPCARALSRSSAYATAIASLLYG
jgi:hypothetical protein